MSCRRLNHPGTSRRGGLAQCESGLRIVICLIRCSRSCSAAAPEAHSALQKVARRQYLRRVACATMGSMRDHGLHARPWVASMRQPGCMHAHCMHAHAAPRGSPAHNLPTPISLHGHVSSPNAASKCGFQMRLPNVPPRAITRPITCELRNSLPRLTRWAHLHRRRAAIALPPAEAVAAEAVAAEAAFRQPALPQASQQRTGCTSVWRGFVLRVQTVRSSAVSPQLGRGIRFFRLQLRASSASNATSAVSPPHSPTCTCNEKGAP